MHIVPLRALSARPPYDAPLPERVAAGRSLLAFLAIAFGFTWACWLSTIWLPTGRWHWLVSMLGYFGPFLAAVVVTARESGRPGLHAFFGQFTRWRFHPAWWAVALLLPPATYYAAIGAKTWITGDLPTLTPFRITFDVFANFFILLIVGGPLGQEPGWRGFAMRRLRTVFGRHAGTIVLGIVWALWHLPILWKSENYTVGMFGLAITGRVAISIVFATLYDRTGGSLLPCLLLHASLDTFFVLLPMEWAYAWWVAVVWVVAMGTAWADHRFPPLDQETTRPANSFAGRVFTC